MAITINSSSVSHRQTKAPGYWVKLNVTLDAAYPNPVGYSVVSALGGGTVKFSQVVAFDDGALKFLRVTVDGTLHVYAASANGAPGAEAANGSDQHLIAAAEISVWCE